LRKEQNFITHLKKQSELLLPRCIIFTSNLHQICFSARLCPDLLGELIALPKPLSWAFRHREMEGGGEERREGKSRGEERGRGLRVRGK